MKPLYKYAGALPYLIAVFLNASIDLGHKILLQNSLFKLYEGPEQVFLTAVVNGLILLPFIIMLSPAGFLSDRLPKNKVMRLTSWAAVFLTCLITVFYYLGYFWLAFATTFLLATQSAFFSPAKFSYLKVLFGKARLAEANGLSQAVAIVAILMGTFLFSILFEAVYPENPKDANDVIRAMAPAGWALISFALVELWLSYKLPTLEENIEEKPFPVKEYMTGALTRQNLKLLTEKQGLWLSVIGLSMFWGLGQVLLASYPAFAKDTLDITNTILIQGTLACTGVGIAIGSAVAGRLSRGYIETGLIPVGAIGLTVGLWLVPNMTTALSEVLCFLTVGFFGGMFIVPLYALVQFYANNDQIGQVIAVNNWVQNIAMLLLLIAVSVAASLNISAQHILFSAACIAVVGSLFTISKLPQSLVRFLLSGLIQRRYKVRVQGMRNIPEEGGVLLLGNHVSWVDWAIVQIACPRPVRFVMAKGYFDRWYINGLVRFFGCIPIQSGASSKESLEQVAEILNNGEVVCLFPEGALSRTGNLVEFKRGFERACEKANDRVKIVPFYLRGLWGSHLSFAEGDLKKSSGKTLKREIIVGFGEAQSKDIDTAELKRRVFDLSTITWKQYSSDLPSLTQGCIEGLCRNRQKTTIVEIDDSEISRAKLLAGACLFSSVIKKDLSNNVGIILPSGAGATIANLATLMAGKVPINLNFTASIDSIILSIEKAGIKKIYTSVRFVKKLQQRSIDLRLITDQLEDVELIAMEDIKEGFTQFQRISQFLMARFMPLSYFLMRYGKQLENDKTATILFSSGSEGSPKGVELSHKNLMSNIKQISDVLDPQTDEVIVASLPPFHAFGLTVTLFMPLVEGIKTLCQPDPTNARGTAKLISKHRGTMLFGSSTFLRLYNQDKNINPLMLDSLRVVVAGAEKLREEVRTNFRLKFGKDILEGYGATETSPVSSVNIPDRLGSDKVRAHIGQRQGTVGMPLPGTSFKIVDPNSFEELQTGDEGMVLIAGSQVMKGYLDDVEKTGSVIKEIDGLRWYITGDKGRLDADGFLSIVDRYSRFAKIGGEMISLSAVEEAAYQSIKTFYSEEDEMPEIMVEAAPSEKKGEVLVLLVSGDIELKQLKTAMMEKGANPLMIPERILKVDDLPKLGSGKPDYKKAKEIVVKLA